MPSRIYGDWGKVSKKLDELLSLNERFKKLLEECSGNIEIQLKDDVLSGALELLPLEDSYLKRKTNEGLDERILVATGEYIEGLKVLSMQTERDKLVLFIGASNSELHHSGLTFAQLAKYINEGTENQPPRPHIMMTWDKIKEEIKYKIINGVKEELKR